MGKQQTHHAIHRRAHTWFQAQALDQEDKQRHGKAKCLGEETSDRRDNQLNFNKRNEYEDKRPQEYKNSEGMDNGQ